MRFRIYCITILGSLALGASIFSQEEPAEVEIPGERGILTQKAVLANLEKSYPIVLVAEQALTVTEYQVLEAEGAFDAQWKIKNSATALGYYRNNHFNTWVEKPTPLWGLSFFAGYRHGHGDFAVYDGKKDTLTGGEVRAGARVPILRDRSIDKMRATLKKAEIDFKLAKLQLQKLRIDINRIAVQRYWKWVAAGMEFKVAEGMLAIAQTRALQIDERIRLGDLPEIERTDNLRVIRSRESMVASARRSFEKASLDLALLLRKPNGEVIIPKKEQLPENLPQPDLPTVDLDQEIGNAIRARPELKEYAHKKDKADVDREIGENQLMPKLDVIIAGSQMFGTGTNPRTDPELQADLVVQVPIETAGPRGMIGQAETRKKQLVQEEKFQRDKIQMEVRDAWSAMAAAKESWIAQAESQVLAHELEEAERIRFDLGDSSMLFVNLREQQSAEAAVKEIQARLKYHQAVADFEAARATFLQNR